MQIWRWVLICPFHQKTSALAIRRTESCLCGGSEPRRASEWDPVWSLEGPVSACPVYTPPVSACEVSCCSWSARTRGGSVREPEEQMFVEGRWNPRMNERAFSVCLLGGGMWGGDWDPDETSILTCPLERGFLDTLWGWYLMWQHLRISHVCMCQLWESGDIWRELRRCSMCSLSLLTTSVFPCRNIYGVFS